MSDQSVKNFTDLFFFNEGFPNALLKHVGLHVFMCGCGVGGLAGSMVGGPQDFTFSPCLLSPWDFVGAWPRGFRD